MRKLGTGLQPNWLECPISNFYKIDPYPAMVAWFARASVQSHISQRVADRIPAIPIKAVPEKLHTEVHQEM